MTRRHYNGTEYTITLLRRSYREAGKVKNETVGNLSHLEDWMIDGLRAMLAGRRLVDLDSDFEIVRSLPHGHVVAVLGVLRDLDSGAGDRAGSLPRARSGGGDGLPAAAGAVLEAVNYKGGAPEHARGRAGAR